MAVMLYYMLTMSPCDHHLGSSLNASSQAAANATETVTGHCHKMLMIVDGLSLRNLLLFIFCTPCQVSSDCLTLPP